MYNHYCAVPDELLPVRDLIMANRKPRPQFVQVSNVPALCECSVHVACRLLVDWCPPLFDQ